MPESEIETKKLAFYSLKLHYYLKSLYAPTFKEPKALQVTGPHPSHFKRSQTSGLGAAFPSKMFPEPST